MDNDNDGGIQYWQQKGQQEQEQAEVCSDPQYIQWLEELNTKGE